MTKTATLTEYRQAAIEQVSEAEEELAKLEKQRAGLAADEQLGDRDASVKLKAVEDRITVVERKRDRARLTADEFARREAEQTKKAEEARIQQLRKKQAGYRNDRQRAYAKVVEALRPLEAAIQDAIDAGAELWSVTLQLHEPPDTKTKSSLTVFISRQLNEAGLTDFDRYGDLYPAVERDVTTNDQP